MKVIVARLVGGQNSSGRPLKALSPPNLFSCKAPIDSVCSGEHGIFPTTNTAEGKHLDSCIEVSCVAVHRQGALRLDNDQADTRSFHDLIVKERNIIIHILQKTCLRRILAC